MRPLPLTPRPTTAEILGELETMGLIIRLFPGRHEIALAPGEALGRAVYPPAPPGHGGHKLLACTIRQAGFGRFGWHPVAEEFLLIGPQNRAPLYLAVFLGFAGALQNKLLSNSLKPSDFVCLECAFNDPETSFFTMNPFVPHGECVADTSAAPPSFYVTEPSATELICPDWGHHRLEISL